MKHLNRISTSWAWFVVICVSILAGCGSTTNTQSVRFDQFTLQIADSYRVSSTAEWSDITYRSTNSGEESVIQFAESQVDSGVTVDQMASLNLQKLELSLPWYEFVEQSSRSIDCDGDHPGEVVSFITTQDGNKLFHSQYYTLINGKWYVWSVSSTVDITRKTIAAMIKRASCI